jgi:hypothetical protein
VGYFRDWLQAEVDHFWLSENLPIPAIAQA